MGYTTLLAILSSYIQTEGVWLGPHCLLPSSTLCIFRHTAGPTQGVLFDRDTLDPVVNTPAFAKVGAAVAVGALGVLALTAYSCRPVPSIESSRA
jgi:hypothetical protein